MTYIDLWLEDVIQHTEPPNLKIVQERQGSRDSILPLIGISVKEHLIGADILERLSFGKAAAAVRNRIPTKKRIRSGDLGEIIATDYIHGKTGFIIPLRRLCYKDDRDMSMRGDDIIGLDITSQPIRVLKAEVKSKALMNSSTIQNACKALENNLGRPKPSSLAFTSMMLRRERKDDIAILIETLQEEDLQSERLTHLIFTFSGNNPSRSCISHLHGSESVTDRRFIGLIVEDHQFFIQQVFESIND